MALSIVLIGKARLFWNQGLFQMSGCSLCVNAEDAFSYAESDQAEVIDGDHKSSHHMEGSPR